MTEHTVWMVHNMIAHAGKEKLDTGDIPDYVYEGDNDFLVVLKSLHAYYYFKAYVKHSYMCCGMLLETKGHSDCTAELVSDEITLSFSNDDTMQCPECGKFLFESVDEVKHVPQLLVVEYYGIPDVRKIQRIPYGSKTAEYKVLGWVDVDNTYHKGVFEHGNVKYLVYMRLRKN